MQLATECGREEGEVTKKEKGKIKAERAEKGACPLSTAVSDFTFAPRREGGRMGAVCFRGATVFVQALCDTQ